MRRWWRGADALSKLPAWSIATCSCQDSPANWVDIAWISGWCSCAELPSGQRYVPFPCADSVHPEHSQLCDPEQLQLKPWWGLQGQPLSPESVRSSQTRRAGAGVEDGVEQGTRCQDIGWGVPGIRQWRWQRFSTSTATSVCAAGVGTAETTGHPKLERQGGRRR